MPNIAINGLGRIGRAAFKIAADSPDLNLMAVNDLNQVDRLVYLLGNDVMYGRSSREIRVDGGDLLYGERRIRLLHEPDPLRLPWAGMGIDVVIECSGAFRQQGKMAMHLEAGAQHVLLSAPGKGNGVASAINGVKQVADSDTALMSTASSSANCVAPVAEIMSRRIGVSKVMITTVQSYPSTQGVIDSLDQIPDAVHACAMDLFPTSTDTAADVSGMLPEYAGRIEGMAIRVPLASGLVSDMTFVTARRTTVKEINDCFREEAQTPRYFGVLGVTEHPIVSSDVMKDPRASLVDLSRTRVVDGDLVKVVSWIDNEWGYASQMVRQASALCGSPGREKFNVAAN